MNGPGNPSFNPARKKEEKGNTPDFSLDKWAYTPEALAAFIEKISKGDPSRKADLDQALKEGGGKAFGLKVCEIIASNFQSAEYGLSVPKWAIVSDAGSVNDQENDDKILRSSHPKEDWLDPRSGGLKSYNLSSFDGRFAFKLAKNGLDGEKLADVPYVLQESKGGFGCVVDIAYSEITGKPVVKLASGNLRGDYAHEGRGNFTSATDDFEASVGIWDSETGQSIIPTRNFGRISLFEDNQVTDNSFVTSLFEAVKKSGIDFGVQMEIIIDPKIPSKINVVQVRPSPVNIKREIPIGKENVKKEETLFQTRSSVVNGCFNFRGKIELIEERFGRFYQQGRVMSDENRLMKIPFEESIEEHKRDRGVESGNICVYDRTDDENHSYFLNYGMSANIYLGAYADGHDVQITSVAIRPNSHHGKMEYVQGSQAIYDFLDGHCGMVSLPENEIEKLLKVMREKGADTTELRVKSDGLIAEISLVKK